MDDAGHAPLGLHELDSFLWKAASSLRGYVPADDYRDYVLPLLFFKWISDTWDLEHAVAVAEHGENAAPEVEASYHRFIIPDGCHWADLKGKPDVGLELQVCLSRLAAANPNEFMGIFKEADWADYRRLPDSVISDFIHSLDQLTLNSSTVSNDTLGATYEYMTRQFADASGVKTGGYVTPQSLVHLLNSILDPQPGDTVYDPACGTGGMLVAAVNQLHETGRDGRKLRLYGQEVNPSTAAIARMNLIIHGAEDFKIAQGDTLRDPRLLERSQLQKFDVVISDPPFSLRNWGAEKWVDDPYRRAFCGIPPTSSADLAWVQHMIASMNNDSGRVGVILPPGALFRSGPEKSIRQCLIERDCLEAVISLPPNLLYSTSIPCYLLIVRAKKSAKRRGSIVFIDASDRYTKEGRRNRIEGEDIELIVTAYRSGESEELPVRLVTNDEIERNDWDLEASRYLNAAAPDWVSADPTHPKTPSEPTDAESAPLRLSTRELGEMCDVLVGRNRVFKDEDVDPEFRVIRAEDIRSELAVWSDLPPSNHRKATSVEVAPGDIIGSRSRPYGRWVLVPEGYGPALASDHTVVLRGRGDVSMWYLLGFLRSLRGQNLIKNTFRGAVISRISSADLKRIPVPYCPLRPEYVDPVLKGFEEEHKRLERGIEELYSRLSLIYESDLSVEVAARLDALQGITASMRRMTDLGEIVKIVRSSYPYPIARNLHAIGNTLSLRERYHEVVHEAPETLSVILTCICAAAARERAVRGDQASKRWMNATSRGGATIGVRNSMIFEVAKSLVSLDDSNDIGGLGRALGDADAPAVVLIRRLLAERNRIHGDYPRTEIQFQQRLIESEDDFQQLLDALGFLSRWELRYAEFVEPLENEDHSTFFSATFRVLRGDNPDWELVTYTSQSPLYRGRVYALVDDQSLIDLHPFILVLPCQVCGALEVYHPDSFDDEQIHLKSIDRGHSQVISDMRLLGKLRAAFT